MLSLKAIIRSVSLAALPVWAVGMTTVIACLMVSHWVPLPHPGHGQLLAGHDSLRQVNTSPDDATVGWAAVHFLYADCPCSRRILNHLVARSPLAEAGEHIVLIGESDSRAPQAAELGYAVCFVSPTRLKERFGVESAPLLIVTDPGGVIRYAGGYTARKQGPDIQDESIILAAVNGQAPDGLPLYGCAVSKQLKDLVDPLRLK